MTSDQTEIQVLLFLVTWVRWSVDPAAERLAPTAEGRWTNSDRHGHVMMDGLPCPTNTVVSPDNGLKVCICLWNNQCSAYLTFRISTSFWIQKPACSKCACVLSLNIHISILETRIQTSSHKTLLVLWSWAINLWHYNFIECPVFETNELKPDMHTDRKSPGLTVNCWLF